MSFILTDNCTPEGFSWSHSINNKQVIHVCKQSNVPRLNSYFYTSHKLRRSDRRKSWSPGWWKSDWKHVQQPPGSRILSCKIYGYTMTKYMKQYRGFGVEKYIFVLKLRSA